MAGLFGSQKRRKGVRAPQQGRSRKTLDRIIAATENLMDGRDYESISVQEICEASEVSPSSFYARFENKETLLFALHERHRAARFEKLAHHAAELDWDAMALREVVRKVIELYVEDRRAHEPYFRSLMLAEIQYPGMAAERSRVDDHAERMIRSHLVARIGSEAPDVARRVEFVMRATCATAQDAIHPPHRFAVAMSMSDADLVESLTDLFCRATGID